MQDVDKIDTEAKFEEGEKFGGVIASYTRVKFYMWVEKLMGLVEG